MSRRSPHPNPPSPRFSIPPSSPRICISCANTTTPPTTVQPTRTTPTVSFLHRLINPDGSWGWVFHHPITILFSIVVFVVVFLITLMVLILNSDVQALYAQNPYNVTGVSPFRGCSARDWWESLLTTGFWLDCDNGSQPHTGSRRTNPDDRVGNLRLRGFYITDVPELEAIWCIQNLWALQQGGGYLYQRVSLDPGFRNVVVGMPSGLTTSSATTPVFSYDPAQLPVSPTRGAL